MCLLLCVCCCVLLCAAVCCCVLLWVCVFVFECVVLCVVSAGKDVPDVSWDLMDDCKSATDCLVAMGITSENVAERYGVDRSVTLHAFNSAVAWLL